MPLRDHFHSPWREQNHWEGFHSAWANTVVRHLNGPLLPPQFRAVPQVHFGLQDLVEVKVLDTTRNMRLVGAVELVSPANKDRPKNRQAFAAICAAYLQKKVGVVIVDIVTDRHANLHEELLQLLSVAPFNQDLSDLYAVAYRTHPDDGNCRLEIWAEKLTVGQPLPTMPLWLAEKLAVPIDLEKSYEETCQVLRMA